MTKLRSFAARWGLPILGVLTALVGVCSLFVGAGGATGTTPDGSVGYFWSSRFPRTAALLLAGSAMALSGMIMQMLARNRFAEPSTAGTVDSATLGVLIVMAINPGMPVSLKMLVGTVAALAGTGLFMLILRRIPLRDPLIVPLIGIMLGGVIGALSSYLAYQLDLLQALSAMSTANFATMIEGRYELMWLALALSLAAYFTADRFTVAGLGDDLTTNLGLNYGRIVTIGLLIVAMNTALVVVHVGSIPFIGLIVPNLVAGLLGDNLRRTAPWCALLGAVLVVGCDIIGRIVNWPYEVPLGLIMSVVGAGIFLAILLRRDGRSRAHA